MAERQLGSSESCLALLKHVQIVARFA